jgi:hypothetical protein
MQIIKPYLIIALTLPGCVLAASDAQALTIAYSDTYSDNMDVNKTAVLSSSSPATQFTAASTADNVLTLPQFDPGLGTLLSATFILDATMNTSAYAANNGSFSAGWDKTQYGLSFAGDSGYEGIGISANATSARLIGSGTVGTRFTTSTATLVNGLPTWTLAGPTLSAMGTFNQGPLAAFIGTNNLSFYLTANNADSVYLAGGLPNPANYGTKTNFIAHAQVIYDYASVSPVPESDSYAMLLTGLGMVGFVSIRRKS